MSCPITDSSPRETRPMPEPNHSASISPDPEQVLDPEPSALGSGWAVGTALEACCFRRQYRRPEDDHLQMTSLSHLEAILVRPSFDNPSNRVLR